MKIFETWADLSNWYRANDIHCSAGVECTKRGCQFGRKDFAPRQCGDINQCRYIRQYNEFVVYTKAKIPCQVLISIPETSALTRDEAALAWFNVAENRQQILDKKEALKRQYGLVGFNNRNTRPMPASLVASNGMANPPYLGQKGLPVTA